MKWTSVKAALPDEYENVLVWFLCPENAKDEPDFWVIGCAYMLEEKEGWIIHSEYCDEMYRVDEDKRLRVRHERISHWMPMPDGPL